MASPSAFVLAAPSVKDAVERAGYVYGDRPFMACRRKVPKSASHARVIQPELVWTFRETIDAARQVGAFLSGLGGLKPGGAVGIMGHNCPEWIMTDFACSLIDARPVGLHGSWPMQDLGLVISDAEVSVIVVVPDLFHLVEAALAAAAASGRPTCVRHVVVLSDVCATAMVEGESSSHSDGWRSDSTVLPRGSRERVPTRAAVVTAPDTLGEVGGHGRAAQVHVLRVPRRAAVLRDSLPLVAGGEPEADRPGPADAAGDGGLSFPVARDSDWSTSSGALPRPTSIAPGAAVAWSGVAAQPVPPGRGHADDAAGSYDWGATFTLMYTSGTSGTPKGIVVDRRRWLSDAAAGAFTAHTGPVAVSHMALAHGADRGICWQALVAGARLAVCPSRSHSHLMRQLRWARPTLLLGLSHFWSRWHSDVEAGARAEAGAEARAAAAALELRPGGQGSGGDDDEAVARVAGAAAGLFRVLGSGAAGCLARAADKEAEGASVTDDNQRLALLASAVAAAAFGAGEPAEAEAAGVALATAAADAAGLTGYGEDGRAGAASGPRPGGAAGDEERLAALLGQGRGLLAEALGGWRSERVAEAAAAAAGAAKTELVWAVAAATGARARVLRQAEASLGGRVFTPVTGGARTPGDVLATMNAVLSPSWSNGSASSGRARDAYGATEFAGISVNGELSGDVEVLLEPVRRVGWGPGDVPVARGELLVRRRGAAAGRPAVRYWGRAGEEEERRVEALRAEAAGAGEAARRAGRELRLHFEGWYRTGDMVALDHRRLNSDGRGALLIVDRVGSHLELYEGGRSVWVAADALAARAAVAPTVASALLYCDRNQPRPMLLVERAPGGPAVAASSPAAAVLADVIRAMLGPGAAAAAVIVPVGDGSGAVTASLPDEASLAAAGLRACEVPAGVVVTPSPWSAARGELTSTGKPRRVVLVERFREALDGAYAVFEALAEERGAGEGGGRAGAPGTVGAAASAGRGGLQAEPSVTSSVASLARRLTLLLSSRRSLQAHHPLDADTGRRADLADPAVCPGLRCAAPPMASAGAARRGVPGRVDWVPPVALAEANATFKLCQDFVALRRANVSRWESEGGARGRAVAAAAEAVSLAAEEAAFAACRAWTSAVLTRAVSSSWSAAPSRTAWEAGVTPLGSTDRRAPSSCRSFAPQSVMRAGRAAEESAAALAAVLAGGDAGRDGDGAAAVSASGQRMAGSAAGRAVLAVRAGGPAPAEAAPWLVRGLERALAELARCRAVCAAALAWSEWAAGPLEEAEAEVVAEGARQQRLQTAAHRAGVAVPAAVWAAGWWAEPGSPSAGVPPELAQSLGGTVPVCDVTGRVIEAGFQDTGRLRRVCLDAGMRPGHGGPLETSAEAVALLRGLAAAAGAALAAGAPGAVRCAELLRRLDPRGGGASALDAASLVLAAGSASALAAPLPRGGGGRFAWSWEGSHQWQVRTAIAPQSAGPFEPIPPATPALLVANALSGFALRPSVGLPDPRLLDLDLVYGRESLRAWAQGPPRRVAAPAIISDEPSRVADDTPATADAARAPEEDADPETAPPPLQARPGAAPSPARTDAAALLVAVLAASELNALPTAAGGVPPNEPPVMRLLRTGAAAGAADWADARARAGGLATVAQNLALADAQADCVDGAELAACAPDAPTAGACVLGLAGANTSAWWEAESWPAVASLPDAAARAAAAYGARGSASLRALTAPLVRAARLRGDLVCVGGMRWLRARALLELSQRVGRALRSLPGVSRGDVVCVSGPTGVEWVAVDIGCALAGLRCVGVHTTADADSAVHVLRNSGAVALVVSSDLLLTPHTHGPAPWSVASVVSRVAAASEPALPRSRRASSAAARATRLPGPDADDPEPAEPDAEDSDSGSDQGQSSAAARVRQPAKPTRSGRRDRHSSAGGRGCLRHVVIMDASLPAEDSTDAAAQALRDVSRWLRGAGSAEVPSAGQGAGPGGDGGSDRAEEDGPDAGGAAAASAGTKSKPPPPSDAAAAWQTQARAASPVPDKAAAAAAGATGGPAAADAGPAKHGKKRSSHGLSADDDDDVTAVEVAFGDPAVWSLPELVAPAAAAALLPAFPLEDPGSQPPAAEGAADAVSSTFTLCYTSGSTGRPKGVVSTVSGFAEDIGEASFATPLATASYIPLSHSSDRAKLWKWLVAGGRVGLLFYAPSHWAAHETGDKKAGADVTDAATTATHGVEGLMAQVAWLSPTHMSCPPRIWSGLVAVAAGIDARAAATGTAVAPRAGETPLGAALAASAFGPRLEAAITGGAMTAPDARAFASRVCRLAAASFSESYGSTEVGGITQDGVPVAATAKMVRAVIRLAPVPELGLGGDGEEWWSTPKIPRDESQDEVTLAAASGALFAADGRSAADAPASVAAAHPASEGLTEGGVPVLGRRCVGEVCVRTGSMSEGYWRDEAKSAAAFVDPDGSGPWWRSGDLAERVRAGPDGACERYRVLGRVSAAASTSRGLALVPGRVEAALMGHPRVSAAIVHAQAEHGTAVVVLALAGETPGAHDAGRAGRGAARWGRRPAPLPAAADPEADSGPSEPREEDAGNDDDPAAATSPTAEAECIVWGVLRSLGVAVGAGDAVREVAPSAAADEWGLAPGLRIGPVAVSGARWTASSGLVSGEGKVRRDAAIRAHAGLLAALHAAGDSAMV